MADTYLDRSLLTIRRDVDSLEAHSLAMFGTLTRYTTVVLQGSPQQNGQGHGVGEGSLSQANAQQNGNDMAASGFESTDPNSEDLRLELRSIIQDGLRQQEHGLEITSQKLKDVCVVPAYLNRRNVDALASVGGSALQAGLEVKDELSLRLTKLEDDLKRARSRFRRVQLRAQTAAQEQQQKERDVLLAQLESAFSPEQTDPLPAGPAEATRETATATPATPGAPASGPLKRKRRLVGRPGQDSLRTAASNQVTSALQQTLELVQSELTRSRMAQKTFEETEANLQLLVGRYGALDSILSSSRTLVSSLMRTQKSDTWYLETTFYMLLATIGWLLFRRLLYGPLWWFAWLPVKYAVKILWMGLVASGLMTRSSSASSLSDAGSVQAGNARAGFQVSFQAEGRSQGLEDEVPAIRVTNLNADSMTLDARSLADAIMAILSEEPSSVSRAARRESGQDQPPSEAPEPGRDQGHGGERQPGRGQSRRGDGQVLQDSDGPRNRMKRMWEEPVEAEAGGSGKERDGEGVADTEDGQAEGSRGSQGRTGKQDKEPVRDEL